MAEREDQLLSPVRLPGRERRPLRQFAWRLAAALGLVVFVAVITWMGRSGYRDANGSDGELSFLDCLYYSTVTLTTTGYGDIAPVSDGARLVTTIFVTLARGAFLVLVVSTTIEFVFSSTITAFRVRRWRQKVRDHIVILGFDTKGRAALDSLTAGGTPASSVVVVDPDPLRVDEALRLGCIGVTGDATREFVLQEAELPRARAVVVAVHGDDTAVLATLTARKLNRTATIAAAVSDNENAALVTESGATTVVSWGSAAGHLLGVGLQNPGAAHMMEDLLTLGAGLDVCESTAGPQDAGPLEDVRRPGESVLAVWRDGRLLRRGEPGVTVAPGDRLIGVRFAEAAGPATGA